MQADSVSGEEPQNLFFGGWEVPGIKLTTFALTRQALYATEINPQLSLEPLL